MNIVILSQDENFTNKIRALVEENIRCLSVRAFFDKDSLIRQVDLSEVDVFLAVTNIRNFKDYYHMIDDLIEKNANMRVIFLNHYLLEGWAYKLYVRNIQSVKIDSEDLVADIRKAIFDNGNVPEIKNLLTQQEERILYLVSNGIKQNEIAKELHISVRTVERHIQNLCVKLKLEKTLQAALGRRGVEGGYILADYEFSDEF